MPSKSTEKKEITGNGVVVKGKQYRVIKGDRFLGEVRTVVKIHSSGHLVYLEPKENELK